MSAVTPKNLPPPLQNERRRTERKRRSLFRQEHLGSRFVYLRFNDQNKRVIPLHPNHIFSLLLVAKHASPLSAIAHHLNTAMQSLRRLTRVPARAPHQAPPRGLPRPNPISATVPDPTALAHSQASIAWHSAACPAPQTWLRPTRTHTRVLLYFRQSAPSILELYQEAVRQAHSCTPLC